MEAAEFPHIRFHFFIEVQQTSPAVSHGDNVRLTSHGDKNNQEININFTISSLDFSSCKESICSIGDYIIIYRYRCYDFDYESKID